MKQPLIIIKGNDCECDCHKSIKGKFKFIACYCDGRNCKSPTTLIFDAEEFISGKCKNCPHGLFNYSEDGWNHIIDTVFRTYWSKNCMWEHCKCSNPEPSYLLSKKGELRCGNCGCLLIIKKGMMQHSELVGNYETQHFDKICKCGCNKHKPFRLYSDAVLKSYADLVK